MEELKYINLPLRRAHLRDVGLYKMMGYKGQKPDQEILDLVERLWTSLLPLCHPWGGYRILEGGQQGTDSVRTGEAMLHTGPVIAEAMQEASAIAIFTVTLGEGYNQWMESIKAEGNIMYEFVANSMGSILADSITEDLIDILRTSAEEDGLKITNNYSPGYCGWALKEQQILFSLLPEGITHIELTDSCLMLPIKSVSGIIGVGRDARKRPYGCAVCNMKMTCHCSTF